MQTATLLRATKSPRLRRVCASHRVLRAFSYTRLLSHTRVVQSEVQFVFPRGCSIVSPLPIVARTTDRIFIHHPLLFVLPPFSLTLSLSLFDFSPIPTGEFYSIESFPPTHEASPSSSYPGFDLIRFVGSRFHSTVTLIPFFFLSQLSTGRANYYTQLREVP